MWNLNILLSISFFLSACFSWSRFPLLKRKAWNAFLQEFLDDIPGRKERRNKTPKPNFFWNFKFTNGIFFNLIFVIFVISAQGSTFMLWIEELNEGDCFDVWGQERVKKQFVAVQEAWPKMIKNFPQDEFHTIYVWEKILKSCK